MLSIALLALSAAAPETPSIELVESWPLETTLDHADIRDADVVWREMIDGARTTLDFGEFYVSDAPNSKLGPVIESIERAAARGVRVRFLADKVFQAKYPEVLARLAKSKSLEVRAYDLKSITGGVLHAKYFIVDGTSTYFGSQNLDWRSLEHIQELGLRVTSREATAVWQSAFEADWAIAGGAKQDQALIAARVAGATLTIGAGPDAAKITPAYSPRDLAPDAASWDLPKLLQLVDDAKTSVRVQLLTYRMIARGEYFAELEDALRRAAARGVKVQLLVADWCMRKGTIEGLQALEPLPNIAVELVTIPQWSKGFVPYGRVVHAKYMVVDGVNAWIGTSNWERDYFYNSRNISLIVEGGPVPKRLDALFQENWTGPYAKPVDPCATYTPPKTGD